MAETITARLRIAHVERHSYAGDVQSTNITATAVYSPDPESPNYSYSQATPWAELKMSISNPEAFGFFVEGKEIDIVMKAKQDE